MNYGLAWRLEHADHEIAKSCAKFPNACRTCPFLSTFQPTNTEKNFAVFLRRIFSFPFLKSGPVQTGRHLDIHDLCRRRAFPDNYYEHWTLDAPFKYPFVKHLVISRETIEFHHHLSYIQSVALHWIRTGFGRSRPIFVCQCGYGARRLFFKYGSLACRECHKLSYASQQQDVITRKRLSAAKLRLQLGGLPDINEPLPAKLKWKHRKRYQALRNQIHNLEASIKTYPFRKPLSTKLFAYHVG